MKSESSTRQQQKEASETGRRTGSPRGGPRSPRETNDSGLLPTGAFRYAQVNKNVTEDASEVYSVEDFVAARVLNSMWPREWCRLRMVSYFASQVLSDEYLFPHAEAFLEQHHLGLVPEQATRDGLVEALWAFRSSKILWQPNKRIDEEGNTYLHVGAKHDQLKAVELLVAWPGCDVNVQNASGTTPLMEAASRDHAQVAVRLLQAKGMNVNLQNHLGFSALMLAAKENRLAVVDKLINIGTQPALDLNLGNFTGASAITLAVRRGHLQMVRKLCATQRANVRQPSVVNGKTPLEEAQLGVGKMTDAEEKLIPSRNHRPGAEGISKDTWAAMAEAIERRSCWDDLMDLGRSMARGADRTIHKPLLEEEDLLASNLDDLKWRDVRDLQLWERRGGDPKHGLLRLRKWVSAPGSHKCESIRRRVLRDVRRSRGKFAESDSESEPDEPDAEDAPISPKAPSPRDADADADAAE